MMSNTTNQSTIKEALAVVQRYRTSLECLMDIGRVYLASPSLEDDSTTSYTVMVEGVLEEADHEQDLQVVEGVDEPAAKVELIMQDVLQPRITEAQNIERHLIEKVEEDDDVDFHTSEHATRDSMEGLVTMYDALSLNVMALNLVKHAISTESLPIDTVRPTLLKIAEHFGDYLAPLNISTEALETTQVLGEMTDAVERIEELVSRAAEQVETMIDEKRQELSAVGDDSLDKIGAKIEQHREANPSGVQFEEGTKVTAIEKDVRDDDDSADLDDEAGEAEGVDDTDALDSEEAEELVDAEEAQEVEEVEEPAVTEEEPEVSDEEEEDFSGELEPLVLDDEPAQAEEQDGSPDEDELVPAEEQVEEDVEEQGQGESEESEESEEEEEESDDDELKPIDLEELRNSPDDIDGAGQDTEEPIDEDDVKEIQKEENDEVKDELDDIPDDEDLEEELEATEESPDTDEAEDEAEEEEEDAGNNSNESLLEVKTMPASEWGLDSARVLELQRELMQWLDSEDLLTEVGKAIVEHGITDEFVFSSEYINPKVVDKLMSHLGTWIDACLRDGEINLAAMQILLNV